MHANHGAGPIAVLMASVLLLHPARAEEPDKAFETLFGKEAAQASATPDTKDDAALAAKLLKGAGVATADPALAALLCTKAYEFGIKNAAGYATAIEAASLLARSVPDQEADCQEKILAVRQLGYRHATSPEEKRKAGESLVKQQMRVAEQRVAAGKFKEAAGLLRQAQSIDSAIQGDCKEEILAASKFAESRQHIVARIEQAKAKLQATPDDTTAAAELQRLYLVELDNPRQAAEYAKLAADETTRRLVLVAGMDVANLPEKACFELGKWYGQLADGATPAARIRMLSRARTYYGQFLVLHPARDGSYAAAQVGLAKVSAELEKTLPPKSPAEIVVEARIDGNSELWVTPTGIYWKNLDRESKPGRYDGKSEPTYVNGKEWMPEWGKPDQEGGADLSQSYALPIGKADYRFELIAVGSQRGGQGIEERDPVEVRTQEASMVIRIPDHQPGGRWYRFRLYRP